MEKLFLSIDDVDIFEQKEMKTKITIGMTG